MLTVAALVLAASTIAFGQTPGATTTTQSGGGSSSSDAEQAILKLTNEWFDAEGRADRAALNRIIADDFQGIGPRGNAVSKRDVIPVEGSRGGLAMKGQDLQARVFGDTAIVTGRGIGQRQEQGEFRFTVLFVRRQNQWQMVAGHISALPRED
jgi:ketosteroid isomerase-like protein